MSSLSNYLASKYLSADPPSSSSTSKKRKRKDASSKTATGGLIITDDDALGWSTQTTTPADEDDGRPITVSSGSAEFRKTKKNAWKTVGVPVIQPKDNGGDEESRVADRIISEAAAENSAAMHDDEGPVVEDDEGVVKMGDGTHAGLQTAADVARQFEKRKREEAA